MLSGSIRIASTGDAIGSLEKIGVRRHIIFRKLLKHHWHFQLLCCLSMTKATKGHRSFLQHQKIPTLAVLLSFARKRFWGSSPKPASERYRWHVPAGFFWYRTIPLVTHVIANIRRYCWKHRLPLISTVAAHSIKPLHTPKSTQWFLVHIDSG